MKLPFCQNGNGHISANIQFQRKLRYRHNTQTPALKGSVIKNRISENTKGTNTVFIKNNAVIMPRMHKMTRDIGTIDDLIWFIAIT